MSRFRWGDRVKGYDDIQERWLFGTVQLDADAVDRPNDVLVKWDSERYDRSARGHLVEAELLTLVHRRGGEA